MSLLAGESNFASRKRDTFCYDSNSPPRMCGAPWLLGEFWNCWGMWKKELLIGCTIYPNWKSSVGQRGCQLDKMSGQTGITGNFLDKLANLAVLVVCNFTIKEGWSVFSQMKNPRFHLCDIICSPRRHLVCSKEDRSLLKFEVKSSLGTCALFEFKKTNQQTTI